MAEKMVRRSFEIYERQDGALSDWAEKLPDINKSGVMRIVIELGLAEFGESRITKALQDGAIRLFDETVPLTAGGGERKTKTRVKRRA